MRKRIEIAIACFLALAVSATASQAASRRLTLKSETVSSLGAHVLAAPNGRTLYRLKPETARHLLCKTACLQFWKPLTVHSKSTVVKLPKGMTGKIGFLTRGKKKFQVTVKGLPLYTYVGDSKAGQAAGQNVMTFGGTWLVLTVKSAPAQTTPAPAPMTPAPTGPAPAPTPPAPAPPVYPPY